MSILEEFYNDKKMCSSYVNTSATTANPLNVPDFTEYIELIPAFFGKRQFLR